MAKQFAKGFYNSKEWKKCRELVFKRDYGLCVRCGKPGKEVHHIKYLTPKNINNPNITLNPDNLITLCKECHFNEHRKHDDFGKARYKEEVKHKGVYYNEKGELCKINVYIVYGSPGSGKTTYVKQYKEYYDLVVDLDAIIYSISFVDKGTASKGILSIAFNILNMLYEKIEEKEIDCNNIWVVSSLPKREEREALKERLDAELIFINKDITTCLSQADNDNERTDKELQHRIIKKWFKNYEV